MTPARRARRGAPQARESDLVREEIYQMNTIGFLDSRLARSEYGARLLRLNPAFAVVAILSLALGVGANTAIFQLLDAVRLRTLPGQRAAAVDGDPHRRSDRRAHRPVLGRRRPTLTNPLWERIRDRPAGFSSAFAWSGAPFNLTPAAKRATRRACG
jgi:hypothetical protein